MSHSLTLYSLNFIGFNLTLVSAYEHVNVYTFPILNIHKFTHTIQLPVNANVFYLTQFTKRTGRFNKYNIIL